MNQMQVLRLCPKSGAREHFELESGYQERKPESLCLVIDDRPIME